MWCNVKACAADLGLYDSIRMLEAMAYFPSIKITDAHDSIGYHNLQVFSRLYLDQKQALHARLGEDRQRDLQRGGAEQHGAGEIFGQAGDCIPQ